MEIMLLPLVIPVFIVLMLVVWIFGIACVLMAIPLLVVAALLMVFVNNFVGIILIAVGLYLMFKD